MAHRADSTGVGWDALRQWGADAARLEPLTGGTENEVWRVRLRGGDAVARLGTRSDADLHWETQLLKHLDALGSYVPVPLPTQDGRFFSDGMVVMTWLEGRIPETAQDWKRVADMLRAVHAATGDWPQRPGWRSSQDLLHAETGTRIDLGQLPPDGAARCRAAWARLAGQATAVIHGDPGAPNIRINGDKVGLIDWDEARVDVPDLDLALPDNAAGLSATDYDAARQAVSAWEAAVCWGGDYGWKRLAEVRDI
ncbi:MAG: phosphotransferase [Pseudomonadota bacterium]